MKPPRTPVRPSLKRIERRAELPRSTKPIRSRKADPAKRRFAKHRCQPYLDWLKLQPCCVTGKRTGECYFTPKYGTLGFSYVTVDPAHVRARGPGHDDLWNALPLAHHLHEEQHTRGFKTFWAKYGLDPVAIAKACTERFLLEFPAFRETAGGQ